MDLLLSENIALSLLVFYVITSVLQVQHSPTARLQLLDDLGRTAKALHRQAKHCVAMALAREDTMMSGVQMAEAMLHTTRQPPLAEARSSSRDSVSMSRLSVTSEPLDARLMRTISETLHGLFNLALTEAEVSMT
jgi:hypothetical protein